MFAFLKKLFGIYPAIQQKPVRTIPEYTASLLLAAPDPNRWIESDFFAHCVVHAIEDRLEAIIAKPNFNMFDTAIEIAELEDVYNRVLPKLINHKHDPMKVRVRAVNPGDSSSSV
jgi:hypothetical protein